jgi:putative endonuclease
MRGQYYVYIMASASGVLYVGMTNDLERRVYEHKSGVVPGFTSRYRVTRLVYFDETPSVEAAIAREKQFKSWSRAKKEGLISAGNPGWEDLAAAW